MLWVQADHGLSGLQEMDRQQFQKIAFPFAGIPQDEDVGVGFVRSAAIQIDDDVAAESVPPNIEAVRIELAGIAEGIKIGNR